VDREFPYPPEKIWRALTQPHLMEEWLMKTDFKPIVGQRFNLRRNPKPDLNIVIDCEVLEVEANKTLSYSWAAMGLKSVVTFTLNPTSSGTHLHMEHSGFPADQNQAFRGATAGWHQFFERLQKKLVQME
jgi:uncharacterized protein YndB with AHSA1/START domain